MACLAGAGLLLPPVPSQLHSWFDLNDLSTLFQDIGGTVPVTGVSDPIGYIANKGVSGVDLPNTGTPATLVVGPNGTTAANFSAFGTAYTASQPGFAASSSGLCMAIAWRVNSQGTLVNNIMTLSHIAFQTDDSGPDHFMNAVRTHSTGGGPVVLTTGAAVLVPVGDYQAGYYTSNPAVGSPAGDGHRYLAPGPGGVLNDAIDPAILDIVAGSMSLFLGNGAWDFDLLEFLLYFRHLVPAEQSLLTAYFDAKHGTLPHT
jgi:hypothetical protein